MTLQQLKEEARIWEMKNGEEIEICKMNDEHLVNTIRMIERNAERGQEVVVSFGYCGDDNYITGDVDWIEGEEYLQSIDEYTWLIEEAKKRKLL